MDAIRNYLRDHYSDAQLAALLAHAEDGKLSYKSCCCFVGAATADHALKAAMDPWKIEHDVRHYYWAKQLSGAQEAELEYYALGENDAERRAKLIPMILEEIARREISTAKSVVSIEQGQLTQIQ